MSKALLSVLICLLLTSQIAIADDPVVSCSDSPCTIITCDDVVCELWQCFDGSCVQRTTYPNHRISRGDNPDSVKSGFSVSMNDPSLVKFNNQTAYIKTCEGSKCLLQSLEPGKFLNIGTFNDESELDSAVRDLIQE